MTARSEVQFFATSNKQRPSSTGSSSSSHTFCNNLSLSCSSSTSKSHTFRYVSSPVTLETLWTAILTPLLQQPQMSWQRRQTPQTKAGPHQLFPPRAENKKRRKKPSFFSLLKVEQSWKKLHHLGLLLYSWYYFQLNLSEEGTLGHSVKYHCS